MTRPPDEIQEVLEGAAGQCSCRRKVKREDGKWERNDKGTVVTEPCENPACVVVTFVGKVRRTERNRCAEHAGKGAACSRSGASSAESGAAAGGSSAQASS